MGRRTYIEVMQLTDWLQNHRAEVEGDTMTDIARRATNELGFIATRDTISAITRQLGWSPTERQLCRIAPKQRDELREEVDRLRAEVDTLRATLDAVRSIVGPKP